MESGDVMMKVTEEYAINKMNFKKDSIKKLWYEGEIKQNLLKYIPVKQQPSQINFEKYINVVLFSKLD